MRFSVKEKAQMYHAVCLAIGMGAERPHDMDEVALTSARDKLRQQLEDCGYFRMTAAPSALAR